jgi:hypothetical protein
MAGAKKHRGPDHAKPKDGHRAASESSCRERCERERSALPVIVGAQEKQHVFEGNDNNEGPQDKREDP